MDWAESKSVWGLSPKFAAIFVGREPFEGLESSGEVAGPEEVGQVRFELVMGVVELSLHRSVLDGVRRAKPRFSSGCESRPAAFAPAGSDRSSRGGNEAAEASGVEGHHVTWRVCRPERE